jgi:hypothetical protein
MDVIISQDAITAATHFVEVCGQHVAFIAGRGEIDEEIKLLELASGRGEVWRRTNESRREQNRRKVEDRDIREYLYLYGNSA